jgi:hypothetical protein
MQEKVTSIGLLEQAGQNENKRNIADLNII